jgi:hypothetical protein
MIEACRRYHAGDGRRPAEIIRQEYYPGMPLNVVYAKMRRLVERNKLDYGVSLPTAFPVEE